VSGQIHQFYAVAFVENLSLKQLTIAFPGARVSVHELYFPLAGTSGMYVYPFGAVALIDVPPEQREEQLARLHRVRPGLTTQVVREDYSVLEDPAVQIGIANGMLRVDKFTPERAGVVALTVAQSAAMEYYERLVDQLFERTSRLVERLETRGTVPIRTRPLHRFIGEAMGTRSEVLLVLHLLDKPDATWEDPAMDQIYNDLRAEFDLVDRYAALELKLRSIQEALELVLDVARDRRLILLEVTVVLLILLEIILSLTKWVR
jgi:uncharacterized Rmd1/YagE family protein